ncbi:MAG: dinitrogenase iron-molybdenum cofactor biosynthesis protein [Proteobacteria bacterium]|nr:dinitrogenase iron-molybdenum cofactor biosynthesis protein [Pseudomonadota bacterium]MBU1596189.1 dinitrogenase iron-molybdenum cofactor biosynthesis protein [Pseudomonadota bacterium]
METVNNTVKDTLIIAIPSENPGGLDAVVGQHFGHCDLYTIVEAKDGKILDVRTLPNVPHQQGGCMAPVNHLATNGVQVLIAGGMGMRPLMGFQQVGVQVYHGANAPTVGHAVRAFLLGSLPAFSTEFTCGGGK